VAADDDGRGDGVQDAEDAYPDHELLKLVRFGAAPDPSLLLDDIADPEQRNEPSEQERRTEQQIREQRR